MPKADDYQPLVLVEPISERTYTLTELWELMKEYVSERGIGSGQYDTMLRLGLSAFHTWLKQREQQREAGDERES